MEVRHGKHHHSSSLARCGVVVSEPLNALFDAFFNWGEPKVWPQLAKLVVARRLLELPIRLGQVVLDLTFEVRRLRACMRACVQL